MSKNLLHKTKLEQFKAWLDANHIEHRPGRGDWQLLQVKVGKTWQTVFERAWMPEHVTVPWPLESIVHKFIKSTR